MRQKIVSTRIKMPKWMYDRIDEMVKAVGSTKSGRNGYILGAIKRDLQTHGKAKAVSYKLAEEMVERVTQAVIDSMNEVLISGLTVEMLRNPQRLSNTAAGARHAAWYILRELNAPLTVIASFYNRNHTSVIYGVTHIRGLMATYPNMKWLILSAKKKCGLYKGDVPDRPEWIEFVTRHERNRCGVKRIVKAAPLLGPVRPMSEWTKEQAAERKKLIRTFTKITTTEGYQNFGVSPEY